MAFEQSAEMCIRCDNAHSVRCRTVCDFCKLLRIIFVRCKKATPDRYMKLG